ncbi:CAT RNA binding domain-containing protein [Bacillus sp. SL00103]
MEQGIGFKKKKGDTLDESAISKTFYSDQTSPLESQLTAIPTDILLLTEKIIRVGEEMLNKVRFQRALFAIRSSYLCYSKARRKNSV